MQLLENFNMRILVYSNANPARKELILTGNLVMGVTRVMMTG